jgi:hypothetical protein
MSIAIKFWHQNFLCITGHAMTFRIGSRKVGMLRDDQLRDGKLVVALEKRQSFICGSV